MESMGLTEDSKITFVYDFGTTSSVLVELHECIEEEIDDAVVNEEDGP